VSDSGSRKDERLLEKDAAALVRGTDACARDFRSRTQTEAVSSHCLFVPVIVTTAELYTVPYSPGDDISPETGEFRKGYPKDLQSLRWARFRKAFTSEAGRDFGDQTIFVVRATAFDEFLQAIAPTADEPDPEGRLRLAL
jgi:hypothetical protein